MTRIDTFTSYGRRAASARVRVFDWIDRVAPDAVIHDYVAGTDNSARSLLRNPVKLLFAESRVRRLSNRYHEIALVSRQATPFGSGAVEEQVLRNAARGIYDFDDALIVAPDRLGGLVSRRRTWRRSIEAADVVIAGNFTLAEQAARYRSDVVMIPSCVEPKDYSVKSHFEIAAVPRAVWLGSPSTEGYLATIAKPLLTVNQSHGLRVTVLSGGSKSLGDLEPIVDRVAWTPEGFAAELVQADFGIMPLTDNEWARGKCAYKLLQYSAASLPSIGSPVGVNRSVLDGIRGLSADTQDEWISGLEQLVTEPGAIRAVRGATAREFISHEFSFDAWESTWRSAVGIA